MDILTNRLLLAVLPLLAGLVGALVLRRSGRVYAADAGVRWGSLAAIAAWAAPSAISAVALVLPRLAPGLTISTPIWPGAPWQVLPLAVGALIAGGCLAGACTRSAGPPAPPALPVRRRTWASFASRRLLRTLAVAAGVLAFVALSAASQTPSFAMEQLPAADGGWGPFPGWPTASWSIATVAALLILVWAALRVDAIRPLGSPQRTAAETRIRRARANVMLTATAAAVILALGVYVEVIGRAGSRLSSRTAADGTVAFLLTEAPLTPALGLLGFVLQLVALTALWGVVFAASARVVRGPGVGVLA